LQLDDIHPGRDAAIDIAVDAAIDAPPTDVCLDEPFNSLDTATWTPYWTAGQPTPQLMINGVLDIQLFSGTPSTTMAYNGLDSNNTFPCTGGTLEVQLVMVPSDSHAEMQLYMSRDASNSYLAAVNGTQLLLRVEKAGVPIVTPVAFDRTTEHYLRLRDGGDGNVYVETANTSGSWNTRIMQPATFAFGMMYLGLGAGTDPTGATSNQTAQFDNLVMHSPACKR